MVFFSSLIFKRIKGNKEISEAPIFHLYTGALTNSFPRLIDSKGDQNAIVKSGRNTNFINNIIPISIPFDTTSGFTVSLRVNSTGRYLSGAGFANYIISDYSGKITFRFNGSTALSIQGTAIEANDTLTFSIVNNIASYYRNGAFVGSVPLGVSYIGAFDTIAAIDTAYYTGTMQDFIFLDSPITANEALFIYENPEATFAHCSSVDTYTDHNLGFAKSDCALNLPLNEIGTTKHDYAKNIDYTLTNYTTANDAVELIPYGLQLISFNNSMVYDNTKMYQGTITLPTTPETIHTIPNGTVYDYITIKSDNTIEYTETLKVITLPYKYSEWKGTTIKVNQPENDTDMLTVLADARDAGYNLIRIQFDAGEIMSHFTYTKEQALAYLETRVKNVFIPFLTSNNMMCIIGGESIATASTLPKIDFTYNGDWNSYTGFWKDAEVLADMEAQALFFATAFKNEDKKVVIGYQVISEPAIRGNYDIPTWIDMSQSHIDAIRTQDEEKWIFWSRGPWGHGSNYATTTPFTDTKVVYNVHSYADDAYTEQCAGGRDCGVTYSGSNPDFASTMDELVAFRDTHNVPVMCGAYGVTNWVSDRLDWMQDVWDIMNTRNIPNIWFNMGSDYKGFDQRYSSSWTYNGSEWIFDGYSAKDTSASNLIWNAIKNQNSGIIWDTVTTEQVVASKWTPYGGSTIVDDGDYTKITVGTNTAGAYVYIKDFVTLPANINARVSIMASVTGGSQDSTVDYRYFSESSPIFQDVLTSTEQTLTHDFIYSGELTPYLRFSNVPQGAVIRIKKDIKFYQKVYSQRLLPPNYGNWSGLTIPLRYDADTKTGNESVAQVILDASNNGVNFIRLQFRPDQWKDTYGVTKAQIWSKFHDVMTNIYAPILEQYNMMYMIGGEEIASDSALSKVDASYVGDWESYTGFWKDPQIQQDMLDQAENFAAFGKNISSDRLIGYQIISEPVINGERVIPNWIELSNAHNAKIREQDTDKFIIWTKGIYANMNEYNGAVLLNDDRVIYNAHTYEPQTYTGQCVAGRPCGVAYDKALHVDSRAPLIQKLVNFSTRNGNAPIIIGAYGVVNWVSDRNLFLADLTALFESKNVDSILYISGQDFLGSDLRYSAIYDGVTSPTYTYDLSNVAWSALGTYWK